MGIMNSSTMNTVKVCTVIVVNYFISFRLLFGKKLAMDGQNFKNFVIMILQVKQRDSKKFCKCLFYKATKLER